MDSQLTLVDNIILPEREASTVLTFTRDSLLNSTLHLRGTSRVAYVIQTNNHSTRTEIRKIIPGNDESPVVVRIDRSDLLADKITFTGIPSMKISQWLKSKKFTDPYASSTTNSAPMRYVWKPTSASEIALYREDIPFRPIVWFRSSLRSVEPAYLALQPEAESLQDVVLASLVIVEQRYRVKDRMASGRPSSSIVYLVIRTSPLASQVIRGIEQR
ncbi:unnamed protein product [Somion occarium]|uniref:DUF6593 domain-containing protein n=1 Tax=Somion occarium TaxID=3059160 RepID=A0ABP1D5H1_9APHY